jgi:glutamate-1-semialdehyde 2,1-aminomutase
MSAIEKRYVEHTPRSAALGKRAEASMPGGDTRTSAFHGPYPLAIARGEGPFLFDLDGNRYIDLIGNYTSLVHGHAYPPIVEAITNAARNGTAWPARNVPQVELGELICERVASIELVRFCNSGTEAGMLAAQLARRVTGRELLVMARYGYHGSHEDFEVGLAGHDGPRTLLADHGVLRTFEGILARNPGKIAAIFLEPVLGSAGLVPPPAGFLNQVKDLAHRSGALFVADEVITLRLAVGGAQQMFEVEPDLTMMGKIIGGGTPVGALGGKADLMKLFDPHGEKPMWHSGTFNGNPLTCAAGVASLGELTEERIARMEQQAGRVRAAFERTGKDAGVPFSIRHVGSLLNIFFIEQAPPPTIAPRNMRLMRSFHLAALNHGLFIAPRGLIALSTVLTDALVDDVCQRVGHAMRDLAAEAA